MARRYVGISERGSRCGQDHPRARLTDADVDLVRELYEEHGLTYRQLMEKFQVSKSTIHDLVTYRRRVIYPVRWKREPPPGTPQS